MLYRQSVPACDLTYSAIGVDLRRQTHLGVFSPAQMPGRAFMVNIEIKETHFCRSDLRIATKLTGSRESEFPPTPQNVLLILKFTIMKRTDLIT